MTLAMPTVGIIANPAAGKDIRRLVAQGRVISNQEKSNILRRVFAGLQSHGVTKTIVMPDMAGLARNAMSDTQETMQSEFIDQAPTGSQRDSTVAAQIMRDAGADCILTLGGDGTNRLVAKGCGDVPLAPISTGTNNVFPKEIEGTLAGIAAATVAKNPDIRKIACRRSKKIEIIVNGQLRDIALVDAAVSRQTMIGARALWDVGTLEAVFLTRAEASSIGIASIGARLSLIAIDEARGLCINFPKSGEPCQNSVMAPIAPGMVREVPIAEWKVIEPNETVPVQASRGTIALDGEREIELLEGMRASIRISTQGPWVVDFDRALQVACSKTEMTM